MNAREMFEQLGYALIKNNKYYIDYCRSIPKYYHDKLIMFDKESRKLNVFDNKSTYTVVDVYEFQAIHQQLKELKWLDE